MQGLAVWCSGVFIIEIRHYCVRQARVCACVCVCVYIQAYTHSCSLYLVYVYLDGVQDSMQEFFLGVKIALSPLIQVIYSETQ